MKVGVPKEVSAGETRIGLVPDSVAALAKLGLEVLVEKGAGEKAHLRDSAFEHAGAKIAPDAKAVYGEADIVLKVQKPNEAEIDLMKEGAVLVALLGPFNDPKIGKKLLSRKISSFAMELIPRISRAQKMDALSSQSTVAGYLAVILAAQALPKFFPLLMTAAGTIPPARVFILGAGVAGLQAIATARRLGAKVEAFDVRPAVKEQVESLGATFVGITMKEAEGAGGYASELTEEKHREEQAIIHGRVKEMDVVITTALIPGKKAPILITEEMVKDMKPGSVIVDLAAVAGGNCALAECGHEVVKHDVKILGPANLPSQMPLHASQMYARNILNFVSPMIKEGTLNLNFEDEVIRDSCVTHQGEARFGPLQQLISSQEQKV